MFAKFCITVFGIIVLSNSVFGINKTDEVLIGNEIRDIAMDDDYVWIATERGVNCYDRKSDRWKFFTVADGLISNQVNCVAPELVEGIFRRKSGDEVWFGTDSGVSVYYKKTGMWKSYTTEDGLVHNKVNAISVRGDDVWIGTEKGASLYDKKRDHWSSYVNIGGTPSSSVTALYHQHDYAWVGTEEGLARYNYKYKKWEYFRNDGSMWYSPDGGPRKAQDSPLISNHINSIDGEGKYVYIATNNSLIVFDSSVALDIQSEQRGYSGLNRGRRAQQNAQYRPLGRSGDRLSRQSDAGGWWELMGWASIDIVSLSADERSEISSGFFDIVYSSGQTWIATDRGLIRFDFMTNARQIFRKKDGMIDDQITTVASTGGEVWAGTPHGLSRYNTFSGSWKNYEMERALPSSYVTALAEDRDGMWFATRGAVSSLKNERWKTFTRNEGLAGDNIKSIAVVGNFVWFGTDEGISRLNKSTLSWDNFNANKTNLVSNNVTSVLVDGKHIWVGTKDGLGRYDNTTGEWSLYTTKTGLLDNYINALSADPEFIWVGTRSGLSRYDKKLDKWDSFKREDEPGKNVITSLALGKDKVWVATKKGLSALDRKTGEWTDYTDSPLTAIAVQRDIGGQTVIWLGGRKNIARYQPDTGEMRKFTDSDVEGISRVNVFGILDTAKYVWFATDGGIYRYSKFDGTWWTYSPSKERGSMDTLADGNVRAISADEDYVYFGTAGGISRYDKMSGNWVNYTTADGLIDNDVYALLIDEGYLWIGTRKGISRYDTISDSWTSYTRNDGLPSDMVYSLAMEKSRKKIWAGTRGGAAYLEGKTWQKLTTSNGLPDNHVWSVSADDREVWFGTNKGAARYNPITESWVIYTTEDGLVDNVIISIGFFGKYVFLNTPKATTIYDRELDNFTPYSKIDGLAGTIARCIGSEQDTKQKIWIGTNEGATLYDFVTDIAKTFVGDDGLANNNIQAITIDGKYVWFGTDLGVSRYDTENDKWLTFRKASTIAQSSSSANMVSPNIKSLAIDRNYLWVGTRIGLSRYDMLSDSWEQFPMPNTLTPTDESSLASPFAGLMLETPPTSSPLVRSMLVNGKYLWLGAEQGLYVYDTSMNGLVGFLSRVDNVDINNIRDIFVSKNKVCLISDKIVMIFEKFAHSNSWTFISDLWMLERSFFFSSEGKVKFSEKRTDFSEGIGLSNLLSADIRDDLLWFGRDKGLVIYNIKKKKVDNTIIVPNELSDKTITAIAFDKRSAWVGTRDGLYRYDFDARTWETFTVENGLASDRISTLTIDDNYVWVGSSNRGVSCYDKASRKWRIFDSEKGLEDNNIRAISADDRYVWFGTFSGGVSRYDKSADLWTNYRPSENREMVYTIK